MKKVKVSFLGLGVIGTQLLKYLVVKKELLKSMYGVELVIDKIFVRDLIKIREECVNTDWLTDNAYEAIENADIVIECIGGNGSDMTKDLVLWSLSHKKAVIMSSKKCLAIYGAEIEKMGKQNQAILKYDATVGGGIPISTVLEHMGKYEQIEEIFGICNATSNYILTQMSQDNKSFPEALLQAQELGIAENNPKDDVNGYDALYKAIILAGFGMHIWINPNDVTPVSILEVTISKDEIIKPIFSVKYIESTNSAQCIVKPKIIKSDSILANVSGKNNIIVIKSSETGERAFLGEGAGAKPTASAMFDDLIKILDAIRFSS